MELQHGTAHKGVRRDRVIAEPGAIDRQDAQPGAREEHRGRGSGDAGTDDDRMVTGSGARSGLHVLLSSRFGRRDARRWARWSTRSPRLPSFTWRRR